MRTWDGFFPKDWRLTVAPSTRALMDTLQGLIPIPEGGDRYVALASWLRAANASGVITVEEFLTIEGALARLL